MYDAPRLDWPVAPNHPAERRWVRWAVAIALGALYWSTASRTIQAGDSGEFIAVAANGGVAHPPGYPLYSLIAQSVYWFVRPFMDLRAFGTLESATLTPALVLSLLSGVFALFAVVLLHSTLIRWHFSRETALLASMVFAVSPVFWKYAGTAEVFSLATLLVVSVFWTAARDARFKGSRRSLILGLIAGLGLCTHHTIILVTPIGLLGLVRAFREVGIGNRTKRATVVLSTALAGLALGLTPYLSLLGRSPEGRWVWGGEMAFGELVRHFLRADYGTLRLAATDNGPGFGQNWIAYIAHLPLSFSVLVPMGFIGFFLATAAFWKARRQMWWILNASLFGWVRVFRRKRFNPHASPVTGPAQITENGLDSVGVLASIALTAVFFMPQFFNLRPEGLEGTVTRRFYILPDVLFCFLAAAGLEALMRWEPRVRMIIRAGSVGILAILVLTNVRSASWSRDMAVEDYLINALNTVPRDSIILGTGEIGVFGFLAVQDAYGYRTDVTYVDLNMLRHRWYYDRIATQVPEFVVEYNRESVRVVDVAANLMQTHQVYVAEIPPSVRAFTGPSIYSYPIGPLLRVAWPSEPLPSPSALEQLNRQLFSRMNHRGLRTNDPDTWAARALSSYARTWLAIAGAYEFQDKTREANTVREFAARFIVEQESSQ
ncbi:MAG: DUF2723 domain-containing protein [Myxococcales bacterium]|nr:DUF2723 domain-containing protein [Myxococcales bacterium]